MAPFHSSQTFRCEVTYATLAAVSAHYDSLSKIVAYVNSNTDWLI